MSSDRTHVHTGCHPCRCAPDGESVYVSSEFMNTQPMQVDVAIVGGGAAGLATSIFATRGTRGQTVVILDGAPRLGAKILVSGGGRCNVTNRTVTESDFFGGSRNTVRRILAAFPAEHTVSWFREIGVDLHEEEHGKLFPNTNRARDVLEALLREAERGRVRMLTGHRVTAIDRCDAGFRVVTPQVTLGARRVVLATGGRSLPKSGSDGGGYGLARRLGHTLVPQTPALVPLVLAGDFHAPLSGISQDVELTVRGAEIKALRVRGALLWTHFGISGPVVLDASRHWLRARLEGREVHVSLNFLPGEDASSTDRVLLAIAAARPTARLHTALAGMLPARVAETILRDLKVDRSLPMAHLPKNSRRELARSLVAWPLEVIDSQSYVRAEVTAGGVPLNEVDSGSLASRKCPGLHLVGEILDVDGRIGGFNFQWAWSTAWAAASAITRSAGAPL